MSGQRRAMSGVHMPSSGQLRPLLRFRRRCSYHQLAPLWRIISSAVPEVVVPCEDPRTSTIGFRLYRRVIEIRDGQLTLRPYCDPGLVAAVRSRALGLGLEGSELDALVEAAATAMAVAAKNDGRKPGESAEYLPSPSRWSGIDGEVHRLTQVSRALRSPAIRTLLDDGDSWLQPARSYVIRPEDHPSQSLPPVRLSRRFQAVAEALCRNRSAVRAAFLACRGTPWRGSSLRAAPDCARTV